ncbi:MAG: flagellar basal body rod protein FlgC [Planctomycetota bacterium]|jgi:flagellar basal-body rod protein FlgC
MFSALDVSTSGLVAQRIRMNVRSNNIANLSTTHNEQGQRVPYQPRHVIFQADDSVGGRGAAGVRVASVQIADVEPLWRHKPNHPEAMKDGPHKGCVAYPNINMMSEVTDALEAARAYEANLGAIEITKDLEQQTLRILA